MRTLALAVMLFAAIPAPAQTLSSTRRESTAKKILLAPVRELGRTARDMVTFRDKPFAILAWSYVAAYSADMHSTKRWIDHCPTCIESGPYSTGSRSLTSISAKWGLIGVAQLTTSHAIKTRAPRPITYFWPALPAKQLIDHASFAKANYDNPCRPYSYKLQNGSIDCIYH